MKSPASFQYYVSMFFFPEYKSRVNIHIFLDTENFYLSSAESQSYNLLHRRTTRGPKVRKGARGLVSVR